MRRRNSVSSRLKQQWLLGMGVFLISGLLLFGWLLTPAIAQPLTQADVVLDGQRLFQVNSSEGFTAQERAEVVNLRLQDAIQSNQPIQVTVEQRNSLPTILLNDRHLLTITKRDIAPNRTPNEQAELWAQRLELAIQNARAERNPDYLRNAAILSLGTVLMVAILSWMLDRLRQRLLRAIRRKLSTADPSIAESFNGLERFSLLILVTLRVLLWVTALLYITNLFPFSRSLSYQISFILLSSFTSPILTLDRASYSVLDILVLGGLMSGLWITTRIFTNFFKSRVLRATGMNLGAQEAIAILTRYCLITIGALVLLQIWGLNISSLTILASTLGIGIGFGLQDIAKNFVSGLVLVFERPIQVGDFIEISTLNGTVERIGARSTEIRTLDQVSIIVPNSFFLQQEVINWSHRNPVSRLHLPVGVSYKADPKVVHDALLEAASHHPNILQHPSPHVFFKGFGDSALNFELLVWITEPHRQFAISSDLYFKIFEVLFQKEIEIPFPQRDLHLRSGSLHLSPQVEQALMRLSEQFPDHRSR